MKLHDFRVISFDCYGTLIDWETGILRALAPLLNRAPALAPDQILGAFGRHEFAQESETPLLLYSEVLARVHARLAKEWGVPATEEENARFGASIKDWPAFPDSSEALKYLKEHFKLAILSNVDRASFAESKRHLQVKFDFIFTAEDIGSYKPSLKNFKYLVVHLAAAGFAKKDILHTAESLFHDHVPANTLGLASAWIHRRHGKDGYGATAQPEKMPHFDFRFTSLAEMADAHAREK